MKKYTTLFEDFFNKFSKFNQQFLGPDQINDFSKNEEGVKEVIRERIVYNDEDSMITIVQVNNFFEAFWTDKETREKLLQ